MNDVAPARQSSPETYLSYVSPLVWRRLQSPLPVRAPDVETICGAVVLIDVERFSAFAERMAARGGEGVEQLSVRINETFGRVVEAVERYGGVAHSFPGDSVIALWPAAERTMEDAVVLATACTLELLERHCDSELPLKAGLSAGELRIAHVGGVNGRLQLLLSGQPLDRMGRAEERSSRGRLIVCDQTWPLLELHASAWLEADGFFEVKSLREAPLPATRSAAVCARTDNGVLEAACAYLPAALLRQLDAGHGEWLGEFREVSTVFIQIRNAAAEGTRDGGRDDDALEHVHEAFAEVQRVLFRHRGDVLRFGHDDKGLIVLAVFGVPPAFSDHSAAHAVTAALEIARDAPAHRFDCRIGIATGRVFCGTLGAPGRREYSVVGSTPNLASRLMQSLNGGVLCDPATAQAAGTAFRFDSAGHVRLKGFAAEIEVFRAGEAGEAVVPGARAGSDAATGVVGRNAERRRLHEWIDGLSSRKGALATVQGEAGVGKSTLIDEGMLHARRCGVDVVCVACEPVQSSSTYATWSRVLSTLLHLKTLAGDEERIARLREMLTRSGVQEELAPLVGPMLGLALEDNDHTRAMSGSARGESLLALLSRLVSHLAASCREAGRPLLLIFEDVHWLDPASWELVGVLTRNPESHPLGMLLTMRSETTPGGGDWHAVVTSPGAELISVAPLSMEETGELARRVLGSDSISAQLLRLTYERTHGNPFFCEQLLAALRESGVVIVESVASLRIRSPEQTESLVPRSVAAVVTTRLDRLPAPVQLTLKTASVIGACFRMDVLAAIHPIHVDEETLLAHLTEAGDLGLVESDGAAAGVQRFRHAITRDVAYEMLLVSQRRQLHREIAEFLTGGIESTGAQAVLFYHWRRSGDEARALEHVDLAGAEAMRNGDYHAVTELYGYALQTRAGRNDRSTPVPAMGKPPREALWSGHLGEALVAIGLHQAARAKLEQCLQMLAEPLPDGMLSLAISTARETLRQFLHRMAPAKYQGSRAADSPTLALAADTYEQLGYVYYSAGETTRGLYAALRILNLSELAGLTGAMARSQAVMSLTASVVGLRRLASLYDRRAVRLAHEAGDVPASAYVGWVTGVRAAGEADWNLAEMRIEAAQKSAEQAGDRRLSMMSLQTLAWPAYVRGDFARAAQLAEAQLAIAGESNNRLWEAWGLNGLSETSVMLGDFEAAVRTTQRSLDVLAEESDRADEIRALGLRAVSLLRLGRSDEALSAARRGLDMMTGFEMTNFSTLEGFAGVAEVMVSLAEQAHRQDRRVPGTLGRDLKRAMKALTRFSRTFALGRPRLHVFRSRVAMLEGSPHAARRHLRRAVRTADDLGMPHEKGLALVAAARCPALDAASRRRHAELAVGVLGSSDALQGAHLLLQQSSR